MQIKLPEKPKLAKTKPMAIPKKEESEFDITINNFNPNKNSPPNSWTNRLMNRLEPYNIFNNFEIKQ
tara:strand:+ start:277 stop:477 length:201 start_codon:yes stop_codon:yes gene_type:complete